MSQAFLYGTSHNPGMVLVSVRIDQLTGERKIALNDRCYTRMAVEIFKKENCHVLRIHCDN